MPDQPREPAPDKGTAWLNTADAAKLAGVSRQAISKAFHDRRIARYRSAMADDAENRREAARLARAKLDPLLDRVLAAIGNEALATAALGGMLIEHAFLKAWGAVAKARNTQQVRLDDPEALEDLGQHWRRIVTDAVRGNPAPPGPPQEPARSA